MGGVSIRIPEFCPLSVHLRYIENKVTLEQIFLGLLLLYPVSIIPRMLHLLHLHLHVVLI